MEPRRTEEVRSESETGQRRYYIHPYVVCFVRIAFVAQLRKASRFANCGIHFRAFG